MSAVHQPVTRTNFTRLAQRLEHLETLMRGSKLETPYLGQAIETMRSMSEGIDEAMKLLDSGRPHAARDRLATAVVDAEAAAFRLPQ